VDSDSDSTFTLLLEEGNDDDDDKPELSPQSLGLSFFFLTLQFKTIQWKKCID
jgi:hypothetical protein